MAFRLCVWWAAGYHEGALELSLTDPVDTRDCWTPTQRPESAWCCRFAPVRAISCSTSQSDSVSSSIQLPDDMDASEPAIRDVGVLEPIGELAQLLNGGVEGEVGSEVRPEGKKGVLKGWSTDRNGSTVPGQLVKPLLKERSLAEGLEAAAGSWVPSEHCQDGSPGSAMPACMESVLSFWNTLRRLLPGSVIVGELTVRDRERGAPDILDSAVGASAAPGVARVSWEASNGDPESC